MKKLSEYAKEHGLTYRGAYNHFKRGLISGAYQLPTGTIVIPDYQEFDKTEYVICYSRVSSSENKSNLVKQSERINAYCSAKGWIVKENVQEIGSGLNDKRKKLNKILKDGNATKVVVEHKDRLSRFGVSYIEECLSKFGCDLVVINESNSDKEDLIQDFVSVITSFCARIYGQRRSKKNTEKLINSLNEKV